MRNKKESLSGLYYPDGKYADREEIRRKLAFERMAVGSHQRKDKPLPPVRDFSEWTGVMVRRQEERRELLGIPESVDIEIQTNKPIVVGLFGDVHGGAEDVNYDEFSRDVGLLVANKGYAFTLGDLTDSFFFASGVYEDIANPQEQELYMQSALNELAKENRLLASWSGNHDKWAADKMGKMTTYHEFVKRYGAHYLEGVSYVNLRLSGDERDVDYKFVGSHQHKGYSIYNDSHAALRMELDQARGADISITAHNHVKAYNQQVVKIHGGSEQVLHMVALGTYKETDRHSRKKGWARKGEEARGGFGLVLRPDRKDVKVFWDIGEAVEYVNLLEQTTFLDK